MYPEKTISKSLPLLFTRFFWGHSIIVVVENLIKVAAVF